MADKKLKIESELGIKVNNPNKTVSMALLESYRRVLYQIKDFYDSIDMKNLDLDMQLKVQKAVLEGGDKLGKNIESLDKLEEKVIKEEKAQTHRKGSAETSRFED